MAFILTEGGHEREFDPLAVLEFVEEFCAFGWRRARWDDEAFQHGAADEASPIPDFALVIGQVVHVLDADFFFREIARSEVRTHNP